MGKSKKNKIIIADQSKSYRNLLGIILSGEATVLKAETETDLLEMVKTEMPDVIIYDLLFSTTKIEVTLKKISQTSPNSKLLILSFEDDYDLVDYCISAGAKGFWNKSVRDVDLLMEVIKKISLGETVIFTGTT